MFIEKYKNNGSDYLRLVESSYDRDLKKQRRKTVKNIGPLSRFDDGKPDYLKRLRSSFKDGLPIIDELVPFIKQNSVEETISIAFKQGSENCVSDPKIFSDIILDHLFNTLGISQFLTQQKSRSKIEYDLLGLAKLMCYGRLLKPASKISTFGQRNDYYKTTCKTTDPYAIYKAMDLIQSKRSALLKKINRSITKSIGRNTDLVFYDVTNFYFETEYPDEEELIDGEMQKGLRQKGVSKENKKSPIVQMGLFMDSNGIPISFEAFAGNALDQTTLRPAMKNTVDGFDLSRFVLVTDRGIMSGPNIAHLKESGHGYIMSKSIKKTAKSERDWILEEDAYVHQNDSFKYKSRIINRTIKDENGNSQTVKQKVVVYWSKKFYEKERKEHESFLEFIEKFKENPSNFRVAKTQQGYLKKFMSKEFMNKMTGEVIHGNELMGFIDEDKLSKNTEFYGYYQIISSELELTETEIIEKYHGLSQIENQFRIMKNTMETRPMYVQKRERIEAHLTVCLISLIMMRLIQYMIKKNPSVTLDEGLMWHEGLSANRIQEALNRFKVDELAQGYYRFEGHNNLDVQLLWESFGLNIEKKLYTTGQLRTMPSRLLPIE